jgi:hypothetical protein
MDDQKMKELGWEFHDLGWWWEKNEGGSFKRGATIKALQGVVYLSMTEDYQLRTMKFKSISEAAQFAEDHFFEGEVS